MTTELALLGAGLGLAALALLWWVRRRRAAAPLDQPPGRYSVRYANDSGARLLYRGDDWREAKRVFAEADQVPRGNTVEFWDGPALRGRRFV